LEPANSVDRAIDAIARHHPAFVLLDVTLGHEKSFPIADELESRGVPFAMMTGYTADDLPPAYRHHTILQKPIGRERLLAAAREGLAARD
jgi:DNA-binding NtrC family response regulator